MDLEAVKRAKQGDVEEIGKILSENVGAMYRVAFGILKNEDEIYDAISNTTVIVFEKIETLKKEEFFKTWLIRILINECYKIYNQNKKIVYLENCTPETLENMQYSDTYSDVDMKEVIKNLSKDLKEVVVLYYFENFSVKEIEEILEIPMGTVKSRLSRAREDLKKVLIKDEKWERRNSNG